MRYYKGHNLQNFQPTSRWEIIKEVLLVSFVLVTCTMFVYFIGFLFS